MTVYSVNFLQIMHDFLPILLSINILAYFCDIISCGFVQNRLSCFVIICRAGANQKKEGEDNK